MDGNFLSTLFQGFCEFKLLDEVLLDEDVDDALMSLVLCFLLTLFQGFGKLKLLDDKLDDELDDELDGAAISLLFRLYC